MAVPWIQPARALVVRFDDGLDALWSLVYAAQIGILQLALRLELETDLALTQAAMDLGEAVEELEWAHPDLPAVAVAVDLGPPPPGAIADCRAALVVLLVAALDVTARLRRDLARELATPDALCLARVVRLLANAHLRLIGRLP
jgi:hypothetical protein